MLARLKIVADRVTRSVPRDSSLLPMQSNPYALPDDLLVEIYEFLIANAPKDALKMVRCVRLLFLVSRA